MPISSLSQPRTKPKPDSPPPDVPPGPDIQPLAQDYGVLGLMPESAKQAIMGYAEKEPMSLPGALMRNFRPGQGPIAGLGNMMNEYSTVAPMEPGSGMVINPKNAAFIHQQIKDKFVNPLGGLGVSPEEVLAEYYRSKHPGELTNLNYSFPPPLHTPQGHTVLGGLSRDYQTMSLPILRRPAGDVAETVAHELGHKAQSMRTPTELSSTYMFSNDVPYPMYENQWWEENARNFGASGRESFNKFLNLISPNWQPNWIEQLYPSHEPMFRMLPVPDYQSISDLTAAGQQWASQGMPRGNPYIPMIQIDPRQFAKGARPNPTRSWHDPAWRDRKGKQLIGLQGILDYLNK